MLAVVDNQLVRIEPVLDLQGGFRLGVTVDIGTMTGQLVMSTDLGPIEAGVHYHIMEEDKSLDVSLDGVTGAFVIERGYGQVKFRAIAGDQGCDAMLTVEPGQ